ncbi:hypothetical protein LAWI1_G002622 [Lachnellula willkommii]|uniref:Heterokaryon incompatibility domain-containing protein n=1 Tax=Lachnellula willkommii TaxID=215461 RepID=A0A559MCN2_9HELO|nr:hypothetical protein LAWI1_G002622 [Lachnellula willkommii]
MPLSAERSFVYQPLLTRSGIRFIVLHPGHLSSPIEVNILQTTLRHNLPFEALSYTWGDHSELHRILVRGQKRCFLHITGNLESALRHLRYSDKTRLLWIDALCIYLDRPQTKYRGNLMFSTSDFWGFSFCALRVLKYFFKGVALASDPVGEKKGLLLCLIEYTEGLATVLDREFPQFPKPVLSYIKRWNAFAPGTSLVPQWQDDAGLSFLDNYLRIEYESPEDPEDEQPGYRLGSCKIISMPLAVWTGGHLETRSRSIPVVMVIGDFSQADVNYFVRHCGGSSGEATRLHRLVQSPEWIYHDLYSAFMDWDEVWDAVRDRLGELDHEVHRQFGTGNIFGRIEGLNKATATNIMLRETLKVQTKSLKTVIKLVKKNRDISRNKQNIEFVKRGDELLMAWDHYLALANGNKEQLQNLVSMMVSLEQISQGQSVGRLNVLAFTFLPLSFVATIFGMTQFTIHPRWYPAYALPMLSLTLLVAIALPKLISAGENWKKPHIKKPCMPKLRGWRKRKSAYHHEEKTIANEEKTIANEESTIANEPPKIKSLPPISMGGALSNASLKHHTRRNFQLKKRIRDFCGPGG